MRPGLPLLVAALASASAAVEAQVPGPTPPPPRDVILDLATLAPGKSTIAVPGGQDLRVRAINRAPAVSYKYWTERPSGLASFAQEFPAIRTGFEHLLHISPECDAYQQAIVPVMTAVHEADL